MARTEGAMWDIRKRSIKVGDQDKLKISLFDDDKYTGWSVWKFISHFLDKDDIIGTADLDVEKLKQPGTHEFNLSVKDKTTVHFSTEYVSSEGTPLTASCSECWAV